MDAMTTYSIRELRAKAGQILDSLAEGEEVIITRRGKPCAVITSVPPSNGSSRADESGQMPEESTDESARPRLSIEELRGRVAGAWPEWVAHGEAPNELPLHALRDEFPMMDNADELTFAELQQFIKGLHHFTPPETGESIDGH